MNRCHLPLMILLGAGLAARAAAQPTLDCSGFTILEYTGAAQDFLIPDLPGHLIQFTVRGADGGDAEATYNGRSSGRYLGGEGATVGYTAVIGANNLEPGGTVRFIVGQRGVDDIQLDDVVFGTASGGGGSALLYLPPGNGNTWEADGVILAAAGSGGGAWAYHGVPIDSGNGDPGRNARADPLNNCGTNGGNYDASYGPHGQGGCDGLGGYGFYANSKYIPTGGAGAYGDARYGDDGVPARAGFPAGGAGATFPVNTHRAGGWGFGGGGAGIYEHGTGNGWNAGGGGGYSGGGGGADENGDGDGRTYGGGGSSYLNLDFAVAGDMFEGNDLGNVAVENGRISYIFIGDVPNDYYYDAIALSDGVPLSGTFCGATPDVQEWCGGGPGGVDVWYTYSNTTGCTRDVTIQVDSQLVEIYTADCVSSVNGVYTRTLGPGEGLLLRVYQSLETANEFTIMATSSYTAGQPDCDSDGIPDACDASDDCPPANDLCTNAINITDGGVYPYDMLYSGSEGPSCFDPQVHDLWYTFTAPADGQLVVVDDADPNSIGRRSQRAISMLTACGGDVLSCTDRSNGTSDGSVAFRPDYPALSTVAVLPMKADESLVIRQAWKSGAITGGTYTEFDTSLPNDRCADAIPLDPAPGETMTVAVNTMRAEYGEPILTYDNYDTWYSYTAAETGEITITSQRDDPYTDATLIALFADCADTTPLTYAFDSDGQAPYVAELSHTVNAGETIYIRHADNSVFPGPGTLSITLADPCGETDSDGDGVGDLCDTCPGYDDTLDADGDGIPDGCDPCDDRIDCDGNLIADCLDLEHPGRFEDFSGASQQAYTLTRNQNADPGVSDGSLVLTRAASNEQASVVFEPVSDDPLGSFAASFDLRITPDGAGADGVSFAILDTANYGSDALWGEDGPSAGGSLAISFDTYLNNGEPGDNFVEIRHNNVIIAQYVPNFWLEYGQWFNADVTFDGAALTLVLTTSAGAVETAFDAVPIPGFTPFVSLYGFGARTGGVYSEHRVDNIRFIDTSNGNDDDGDGVINPCDICPGFDDNTDSDGDGIPDGCDCAADFNNDGDVNTIDILNFLNAWTSGDPRGDFNGDGAINTLDILDFLNVWTVGC